MGILRTDKISGLETPTAVTGSVNFPGTDDYITAPANTPELLLGDADFTIEGWFYKTGTGQQDAFGLYQTANSRRSYLLTVGDSSTIFYYNYTGSSGTSVTASFTLSLNEWVHVAITKDGTTLKIYVDGKLSGTTTGLTSGAYANTDDQFMIGSSDYSNANGSEWTGHISNLRIVKGYVLYNGDFTVPDHALEVVPGTVLLACNNPDSVTAVESALIGKGLTLTAVNDVAISSINPSLTRDFTSGTEFRGVTTFDTQGYFVPPSGTTAQRGRDRGLIGGGTTPNTNSINYIRISSQGNAKDFGDLTSARFGGAACASSTRGVFIGGASPGLIQDMEFVTIASEGNAIDFGGDTQAIRDATAGGNNVRGFKYGGIVPGSARTQQIDTFNIASTGQDATDFGDLTTATSVGAACGSSTRGLHGGGTAPGSTNVIEFITYGSTGTVTDFGELTRQAGALNSCSSSVRGVWANGGTNTIDYVTIATRGNAQDFGDSTLLRTQSGASCSNSLRGVFCGGYQPSPDSTDTNVMDFIIFATTGNAKDFGDLPRAANDSNRENAGCSDSHGGIS